jgi:guanine deaminase
VRCFLPPPKRSKTEEVDQKVSSFCFSLYFFLAFPLEKMLIFFTTKLENQTFYFLFLNTMDQQYFMNKAVELSLENMREGKGGPFGAIIVKDGKIVGTGANHVTSENDPTAHAEVVAIRDACKNLGTFQLDGCEIYTSCEPCPMCLAAIYRARPKAIYYANTRKDAADIGFDDDFLYEELKKDLENRNLPIHQLDKENALKVFDEWKKKSDKIEY